MFVLAPPITVAQPGVSNVVISGNSRILLNYRAPPMTDVVTSDRHEDYRDRGDRGVRNDGICAERRAPAGRRPPAAADRRRAARRPTAACSRRSRSRGDPRWPTPELAARGSRAPPADLQSPAKVSRIVPRDFQKWRERLLNVGTRLLKLGADLFADIRPPASKFRDNFGRHSDSRPPVGDAPRGELGEARYSELLIEPPVTG